MLYWGQENPYKHTGCEPFMKMNPGLTNTKTQVEDPRHADRLFLAMKAMAWGALLIGLVLSLMNIGNFSDSNLMLMVGIGFLVGSVQIFTIGTAIHLVHKRKMGE